MKNTTNPLEKTLKKIAYVRKSTRGTLFVRVKDQFNEDHQEAVELLLSTIYGEYDGNFGTYTVEALI